MDAWFVGLQPCCCEDSSQNSWFERKSTRSATLGFSGPKPFDLLWGSWVNLQKVKLPSAVQFSFPFEVSAGCAMLHSRFTLDQSWEVFSNPWYAASCLNSKTTFVRTIRNYLKRTERGDAFFAQNYRYILVVLKES